jgi:hypothetical protein
MGSDSCEVRFGRKGVPTHAYLSQYGFLKEIAKHERAYKCISVILEALQGASITMHAYELVALSCARARACFAAFCSCTVS